LRADRRVTVALLRQRAELLSRPHRNSRGNVDVALEQRDPRCVGAELTEFFQPLGCSGQIAAKCFNLDQIDHRVDRWRFVVHCTQQVGASAIELAQLPLKYRHLPPARSVRVGLGRQ
jgi:hypothetical protein